ncbi:hypothetical protein FZEAL_3789 [Fusarium zealandicum]|uniref:Uncharacterized protein n=1 Tax=Fusarium zealandicum TaxID=1053134 RepID=A0A8H4UNU9_9HYPO|nr:hypothetical protein FZEAL_3789 [Fusarium zealandicum]
MRFGLVVLSALPTSWAAHAYAVPQGLALQEADADSCNLPDAYSIGNFKAESKDSGKTLTSLDFDFSDKDTDLTTPCHKNSSSKAIDGVGGSPRYACDNAAVEFLWDDDDQKLWMMEKVCIEEDGTAQWEAGGSAHLPLKCARTGGCTTNSTDHRALFTSLNPSIIIWSNLELEVWNIDDSTKFLRWKAPNATDALEWALESGVAQDSQPLTEAQITTSPPEMMHPGPQLLHSTTQGTSSFASP